MCELLAVVPRVLHWVPVGQTGAVSVKLRVSVQKLLSYWVRKFQKNSSS
jgi:hypothetical protein